jgi:hypothetical protein
MVYTQHSSRTFVQEAIISLIVVPSISTGKTYQSEKFPGAENVSRFADFLQMDLLAGWSTVI